MEIGITAYCATPAEAETVFAALRTLTGRLDAPVVVTPPPAKREALAAPVDNYGKDDPYAPAAAPTPASKPATETPAEPAKEIKQTDVAAAVQTYLHKHGIPAATAKVKAFGECVSKIPPAKYAEFLATLND
jgi:hypothetical protein